MRKLLTDLESQVDAIKLANHIILDVDNTVTKDLKPLSIRMSVLLRNLLTKFNKKLYFMSGTSVPELKKMVSVPLKCRHTLCGGSGTHIIKLDNKCEYLIRYDTISELDRLNIINLLENVIRKFKLPIADKQILDRKTQITLSCIGRYADTELKNTFDPGGEVRRHIVKYLKKYLPNFTIKIGGTTSIDISEGDSDKAVGIAHLEQCITNLNFDNTIFIGDSFFEGGNDKPALELIKGVEVTGPEQLIDILRNVFK